VLPFCDAHRTTIIDGWLLRRLPGPSAAGRADLWLRVCRTTHHAVDATQADPLWGYFSAVAGPDGTIDAAELQRCITNSGFTREPFSLETCRLMITMLDTNFNGTMDFGEFRQLWDALHHWKNAFLATDVDNSGTINVAELQGSLMRFGYNFSPALINVLVKRYVCRCSRSVSPPQLTRPSRQLLEARHRPSDL
jgi:Ca2+-binding EF-hand superfamily protein